MRSSGSSVTRVSARRTIAERLEPRHLLSGAPPVLTSFTVGPDPVPVGAWMSMTANYTDPEGDAVATTFYRESNGTAGLQTNATGTDANDEIVHSRVIVLPEPGSQTIVADPPQYSAGDERHTYYALITDGTSEGNVLSASVLILATELRATPAVAHDGDVVTLVLPLPADGVAGGEVSFFQETNGMPGLQDDEGDLFLGRDAVPDYPGRDPAEYSVSFIAGGQVAEQRTYYATYARTAVLVHNFEGPGGTPQDPYEPNHSFETAAFLPMNTRRVETGLMYHPIGGGEYYRVLTTGPGTFGVELTPDPAYTSDLVVEILDPLRNVVARSVPADWQPGLPHPPGPRVVSAPSYSAGDYYIRVFSGLNDTRPPYALTLTRVGPTTVINRELAYKNSVTDGYDARPGVISQAVVDTSRSVAWESLAENTPFWVTGYARGINAVVVDISGLPPAAAGGQEVLSASDFEFRVGNGGDPSSWRLAPAPNAVAVHRGAGYLGTDRVAITWTDGAVANTWLQVTTRPTAATGLEKPDAFYFGSLIGDTGVRDWLRRPGQPYNQIDVFDLVEVRRNLNVAAQDIAHPYDHNKDLLVNNADLHLTLRNMRRALGAVTLPPPAQPSAERSGTIRPALRRTPITRSVFAESAVLA